MVLLLQINRQKPCENNYISLVWILTSKHFFSTGQLGEERDSQATRTFKFCLCNVRMPVILPGRFLLHDQPVPRGHCHPVLRDQAAGASADAGAASSVFILLHPGQ